MRGYDLDLYKHVNNARYLEYLEAARWDYIEKYFDQNIFQEQNWGIAVVRINIRYRQAALFGDVLEIKTWEIDRNRISCTVKQEITRKADGKRIAEAEVNYVMTDLNTGRPVPIDERINYFLDNGRLPEE